jgi:hypothetical protein
MPCPAITPPPSIPVSSAVQQQHQHNQHLNNPPQPTKPGESPNPHLLRYPLPSNRLMDPICAPFSPVTTTSPELPTLLPVTPPPLPLPLPLPPPCLRALLSPPFPFPFPYPLVAQSSSGPDVEPADPALAPAPTNGKPFNLLSALTHAGFSATFSGRVSSNGFSASHCCLRSDWAARPKLAFLLPRACISARFAACQASECAWGQWMRGSMAR